MTLINKFTLIEILKITIEGKIMLKKISLYLTSLVFVFTTIGSAYAVTLKASHQWPGTPRADGSFDPRHEICLLYTSDAADE